MSLLTGEKIDRGSSEAPCPVGHDVCRNTSCWYRLSSRRGADYPFGRSPSTERSDLRAQRENFLVEPSLRGEMTFLYRLSRVRFEPSLRGERPFFLALEIFFSDHLSICETSHPTCSRLLSLIHRIPFASPFDARNHRQSTLFINPTSPRVLTDSNTGHYFDTLVSSWTCSNLYRSIPRKSVHVSDLKRQNQVSRTQLKSILSRHTFFLQINQAKTNQTKLTISSKRRRRPKPNQPVCPIQLALAASNRVHRVLVKVAVRGYQHHRMRLVQTLRQIQTAAKSKRQRLSLPPRKLGYTLSHRANIRQPLCRRRKLAECEVPLGFESRGEAGREDLLCGCGEGGEELDSSSADRKKRVKRR